MNDLWDRDLDSQVERTKSRPLASGVLSIRQGLGETALCPGLLIVGRFSNSVYCLTFYFIAGDPSLS